MQRKNLFSLLGILVMVLVLAGCAGPSPEKELTPAGLSPIASGAAVLSQNDLKPEEIRAKVLAAIENVLTYSFSMTLDINLLSQNGKNITQQSEIYGAINKPDKKMRISMTVSQRLENSQAKEGKSGADIYVDGENMYMKKGGSGVSSNWQKQSAPAELWQEQDVISQQKKLLETSEIRLGGTARIKDRECYLLEIKPDVEAIMESLQRQMPASQLPKGADLEEMLSDISMQTWIDRETFLPLRVKEAIVLNMDTQELGIQPSEGATAVTMKMNFDLTASDYNRPLAPEPPTGLPD
jgi:outer membrane lipoprotein-sorting protein